MNPEFLRDGGFFINNIKKFLKDAVYVQENLKRS